MANTTHTDVRPFTNLTRAIAVLLVLTTGCARTGVSDDHPQGAGSKSATATSKPEQTSPQDDIVPSRPGAPPTAGTPISDGEAATPILEGLEGQSETQDPFSGQPGPPASTTRIPSDTMPPAAPGAPPKQTPNPPASGDAVAPSDRGAPSSPEGSTAPDSGFSSSTTTTTTPSTTTTSTTPVDQAPIAQCADLTLTVAGVFETYDYWLSKDCFTDPAGETIKVFSTQGNFGSVSAPSNQYCGSLAGNAWCWQYQPQSWDGIGYWDSFNIWAEDAAGNQSAPIRIDLCVNC